MYFVVFCFVWKSVQFWQFSFLVSAAYFFKSLLRVKPRKEIIIFQKVVTKMSFPSLKGLYLKVTFHANMAMPNLHRYSQNYYLINNTSFFWIEKFLNLIISICFPALEMHKNIMKSNSYLTRKSFLGYFCESDIANFAWRVT